MLRSSSGHALTGAQRVARYRQRKREAGLSLTWSRKRLADPPAARGQPKRDGPDFWPTPPCLIAALVRYVLPELPPGPIWDCARGDGRLVRAMAAAGRTVVGTDLYPQDGTAPHDFLTDPPPWPTRSSSPIHRATKSTSFWRAAWSCSTRV